MKAFAVHIAAVMGILCVCVCVKYWSRNASDRNLCSGAPVSLLIGSNAGCCGLQVGR